MSRKQRFFTVGAGVAIALYLYWQWATAEPTTAALQVSGWAAFAILVICLSQMIRAIE